MGEEEGPGWGGCLPRKLQKPRMARTFVVNGSRHGSGYRGAPRAPQYYCCGNIIVAVVASMAIQVIISMILPQQLY